LPMSDDLADLGEMDNYVWSWDTKGVPPGIYRVVRLTERAPRPLRRKLIISAGDGVKFAPIDQSGVGSYVVVNKAKDKRIRVLSYFISLTSAGSFQFRETGGPPLTGLMSCGTTPISYLGAAQTPAFETVVGSGLEIFTTGGSAKGHLSFAEI